MTESESRDLDAFARQALIGGQKVPALWGLLGGVGRSRQANIYEYKSSSLLLPLMLLSF